MMPGTADGIPDHQPLGERASVVRASRPDRAQLGTETREQHRLSIRVTEERLALLEKGDCDALCQIGPGQCSLFSTHGELLQSDLRYSMRSRRWSVVRLRFSVRS